MIFSSTGLGGFGMVQAYPVGSELRPYTDRQGLGGISFAYKKLFIAFSLACFAFASFLFRYVAPRALLHGLHDATYPSSMVPPLSDSTR